MRLPANVLQKVLDGLAASSAAEIAATVLGVAYSILAVRRNRYCWVAGAGSSVLLAYLAAGKQLPMQALLQAYYVLIAGYGFWHWRKLAGGAAPPVGFWPLRQHLLTIALLVGVAWVTAQFLASETQAAWPLLDSFATWFSLFATWLVARAKIENWLYWVVIDAGLVILFAAQGLYFVALLYAIYMVIACVGFVIWLKKYRLQTQLA
jgi:nicotinamide mononucleotide transporter